MVLKNLKKVRERQSIHMNPKGGTEILKEQLIAQLPEQSIDGINLIRSLLISYLGHKQFTQIINGNYHNMDEENETDNITFVPGKNSDFNLIRLYIQIFFPFQIIGTILIIDH